MNVSLVFKEHSKNNTRLTFTKRRGAAEAALTLCPQPGGGLQAGVSFVG